MISAYVHEGNRFYKKTLEELGEIPLESLAWIDLFRPTDTEAAMIRSTFGIELPEKHEREEIESSSRYWEDDRSIMINSYFFVSFFFADNDTRPFNESVTFILQDDILFTVRDKELHTFETVQQIITSRPKAFMSGYDILMQIFDVRIGADADLLEYAAKESDEIRKKLLLDSSSHGIETLRRISLFQEFMLKVRQSVYDKRRILTALAKSPKVSESHKEEMFIMMKDVNSLVEFASVDMNTLDNLQNLFLAQISIEQNKIIKLFTVASVVLMPPTLVASIYGMNFRFMPELGWSVGYPLSLALMFVAGSVPVLYFRKKGWL